MDSQDRKEDYPMLVAMGRGRLKNMKAAHDSLMRGTVMM